MGRGWYFGIDSELIQVHTVITNLSRRIRHMFMKFADEVFLEILEFDVHGEPGDF